MEGEDNFHPLSLNDLTTSDNQLHTLAANFYFSRINRDFSTDSSAIREEQKKITLSLYKSLQHYCATKGEDFIPSDTFGGWMCKKIGNAVFFYAKIFPDADTADEMLIIQVGASTQLPLPEGWIFLFELLQESLSAWPEYADAATASSSLRLIGHTLVYKSNAKQPAKTSTKINGDILQHLQPISGNNQPALDIASHYDTTGSIFLVGVNGSHALHSSVIYLVICEPQSDNQTFIHCFFSDRALFTMSDIYVHKASYQWLQLHQPFITLFENKLNALNSQAQLLINTTTSKKRDEGDTDVLKQVGDIYNQSILPYTELRRLELSLEIQQKNFRQYFGVVDQLFTQKYKTFFEFFDKRIAAQREACSTMLSRMSILLETVKTITSLAEAKQAKENSDQMSNTQLYLAIIGAGLAFVQIFDNEVAVGFLKVLGIVDNTDNIENVNWQLKLATKCFVAIVILFVILLFNRRFRKKKL